MSIRRKSINDGTTISKKMKCGIDERDSEVPRRDKENKAKIGGPRTESAFDVRMPETTSAQEVPQRITASLREIPYRGKTRGQVRVKTRLRCRTSQGKYKVVNYVDKKTWSGTLISSR